MEVNKGQKRANFINPWAKKIKAKEPHLVQLQNEKAEELEKNKQTDTTPSRWKEQIKKSIKSGSTLKQAANTGHGNSSKKTLAKTMFSANQEWLDKAARVVQSASPPLKENGSSPTNQTKPKKTTDTKITAHFKTSTVTPTTTNSGRKKEENPYKTLENKQGMQKMGSTVAKEIQNENPNGTNQEQTKWTRYSLLNTLSLLLMP